MKTGITIITPTGDRPEAFALCERWMSQQTLKPDQWIVIDDGQTPTIPSGLAKDIPMIYGRREALPDDPPHTLARNMTLALKFVAYEKVIIIEDDDYYSKNYIKTVSSWLDKHDLVGQIPTFYYHVGLRMYRNMSNRMHSSWFQTGFNFTAVTPCLNGVLRKESLGIDTRLWRDFRQNKYLFTGSPIAIGMKGMPGRKGLTVGHDLETWKKYLSNAQKDVDMKFLKDSFMGSDTQYYTDFYDESLSKK